MDTHRLEYFLRIADEGSITRAANMLGIAQPALSRQLRLLEEDLGVTLFRRTRQGVDLTEEGQHLRDSTAAPLRQLERAVKFAGSPLARLERGMVLGMPETTAEVLAAPLLTCLTEAFPAVTFSVTVGNTDHLVDAMLKGTVDVALINPTTDDRVFYHELLAEDLVVVGGPQSGLNQSRPVPFRELVKLPLVVPRSPTGIGNVLQKAALRAEATFRCRTTTDSLVVMKLLIEAGLVYGVLPLSAFRREADSARLHFAPVCEPVLTQHLGVAGTSRLELPREFAVRVGNIIREQVSSLVDSDSWPAQFLSPQPFDP